MGTSREFRGREKSPAQSPFGDDGEAKTRLLRAAVLLFAEKGFGGVSIREIATAADRNSSSISFHFGGKEGIHQAAVGLACQQVRHMVDSFPLLPGEGESDSKLKSEVALRGAIRAILLSTLPAPSPSVEDGAFACALIVLFLREMAFPLPETEPHVLAAVRSHVNYMDRCIRFIRPDLV
jgi:AcrR family transcriptional regulator